MGSLGTCIVCNKPRAKRNIYTCSYKCAGLYKQNYKKCIVCGESFKDSPANDTKCCSTKCSKLHRQRMHSQGRYVDNMAKMFAGREKFCQEYQGEKHINAKHWVIQSPSGKEYKVDNLMHFIKTNPDLFDGTPKQTFDGFAKIKATAQGKLNRNKSYSWKGWKLLSWSDERFGKSIKT